MKHLDFSILFEAVGASFIVFTGFVLSSSLGTSLGSKLSLDLSTEALVDGVIGKKLLLPCWLKSQRCFDSYPLENLLLMMMKKMLVEKDVRNTTTALKENLLDLALLRFGRIKAAATQDRLKKEIRSQRSFGVKKIKVKYLF